MIVLTSCLLLWEKLTVTGNKCGWCCFFFSSWSQSDLLLARRPWGQHAEVHLYKPFKLPLPQSTWRHHKGGCAGRLGNREAEVQQLCSHLCAAEAAGSRPGAVCKWDVQRVWFHGEGDVRGTGAEHRGTLQQVPNYAAFVAAAIIRITQGIYRYSQDLTGFSCAF